MEKNKEKIKRPRIKRPTTEFVFSTKNGTEIKKLKKQNNSK